MSQRRNVANILIAKGTADSIRSFKRTAFQSKRNRLSFTNIWPYNFIGDLEFDNPGLKRKFGLVDIPKKIRIIDESDECIKFFFISNGICQLHFMSEAHKDLVFEHAYAESSKETNLAKEQGVMVHYNDSYLLKYKLLDNDQDWQTDKDPVTSDYLEELIRKVKTGDKAERSYNAFLNVNPDLIIPGLGEYFEWFNQFHGKRALLLVDDSTVTLNYDLFPFDLVILNVEPKYYGRALDPLNVLSISRKVIKIDGNPARTLRFLLDFDIRIKCFVALSDGCSAFNNYSACAHVTEFFDLLSPVLSDESFYYSDRDFITRHVPERFPVYNSHFPHIHFLAKSVGLNAFPFDVRILALCSEERYLLSGPTPSDPSRMFKLQRLPTQTEVERIGQIEVRLSNASVFDFEGQFDCIVPNKNLPKTIRYFIPDYLGNKYIINDQWFLNHPFKHFLEEVNLERWNSIGIGIDNDFNVKYALEAVKNWKKDFPEKLHFFVMDPEKKSQFSQILKYFKS